MALMQPCSAPISPVAQTCLSRSAALKGGSCYREDSKPQSQKATLRYTGRGARIVKNENKILVSLGITV